MAIYTPITVARFWSKVAVPSGDFECWEWQGAVGSNGYGRFRVPGVSVEHAHRVAWQIANGAALGDKFACHTCDNKRCVNPHHIYAGDRATNARDAVERGLIRPRCDQGGEANPSAKLTAAQVVEIRKMIAEGHTNTDIANLFPVSHAMVSRIRRGRSWRHSGFNEPESTPQNAAKSLKSGGPGGSRTPNQTVMSKAGAR
jgi:hypothetical protein